jgi:hypothetical protein
MRGHVAGLHRAEVGDAGRVEPRDVPLQIAPVRAERVGRERPLDREVVEVGVDGASRGDQLSTS